MYNFLIKPAKLGEPKLLCCIYVSFLQPAVSVFLSTVLFLFAFLVLLPPYSKPVSVVTGDSFLGWVRSVGQSDGGKYILQPQIQKHIVTNSHLTPNNNITVLQDISLWTL